MEIEDQVCSLELALKLNDLKAKQKSTWCWVTEWENGKETRVILKLNEDAYSNSLASWVPAFTVAELGELLPRNCYTQRYLAANHPTTEENKGRIEDMKANNWYCVQYDDNFDNLFGSPTEADARAKMLIYLIENDLIK